MLSDERSAVAVQVRMFAAAREAAGQSETHMDAGPLPQLLAGLADRYGARFAAVLEVSSVLVDGSHVERGEDVTVADGAEVAILPPFSGGAVTSVLDACAPGNP